MLRGSEEVVRTILIVAANKPFGESLREQVAARGFAALLANAITEARRIVCRSEVHGGIFEYLLPDGNGIELAQELRALNPQFCFGIINGPENFSAVLDSMRNGAVEYLLAPTAPESVAPVVAHFSKQKAPQPPPMDVQCTSLTGTSVAIQTVRDQICQIAGSDYPVLILGETGTGKE